MLDKLKELLKCLEDGLDEKKLSDAEDAHRRALNYEEVERLPLIVTYPYPEDQRFMPFPHSDVFDDREKMLFNQFVDAFDTSVYLGMSINYYLPVTIRANFGCVLVASALGGSVQQVENNPPWIVHNKDIPYQQIIDQGSADFSKGWLKKATSRYEFYIDVLKDYPKLQKVTNVVLPDLQGPLDNLELIRGSGFFMEMITERDLCIKAMEVLAKAQIEIAAHFSRFVTKRDDGLSFQHAFAIKGGILLRDDIAIMISPQMYGELVGPFEDRVLSALGGGVHSCGVVDRIVPQILSLDNIECFDFGQAELNGVGSVYKLASPKKIALTRVTVTEEEIKSGKIMEKYPTGISLIFRAKSYEHARDVMN
jgi:hypothetical protein